ncbi:MAG: amidohydrolase family protein [Myxococcota bacterium]|nr:amidohydrolase family protein [Myxococcota bacterium]
MIFLWWGCSFLQTDVSVEEYLSAITLENIRIAGKEGEVNIRIQGDRIAGISNISTGDGIDKTGFWIVPAFVDSHVHFAYLPPNGLMLDGGVASAVDLASPVEFLSDSLEPMHLLRSGPMVTAVDGYPTQGWGADGYGLGCADETDVENTISELAYLGVDAIKMPITESPSLTEEQLALGVSHAHALGLRVVTHAMNDAFAQRAARANMDVLAHTPTQPLLAETVAMWSERTVISTLAAFGGAQAAVDNLSALHQSGSNILYGTDYGNLSQAGILEAEIVLLEASGLSGTEIIAAGTENPVLFWGIPDLGFIEEDYKASFLIVSADPSLNPSVLAHPTEVWIDGVRR